MNKFIQTVANERFHFKHLTINFRSYSDLQKKYFQVFLFQYYS